MSSPQVAEWATPLQSRPEPARYIQASPPPDAAWASVRREQLRGLRAVCRDRIVDADAETAEERGRLNAGDPLCVIGGPLAASARARGWTLVSRNTAGLARSGATRLNPFVPGPMPSAGQHG